MRLQILLSAYNGEAYIGEQMDSILSQSLFHKSGWEIGITVRDDGSADGTWEILENYAAEHPQITLVRGENVGVIESFFTLLRDTEDSVDFVALSDQDDVWMEDKLEQAVCRLQEKDGTKPLLYCGKPMLTDETLQPIPSIMYGEHVVPSFGNALIENICTGCTAVCNRQLVRLVKMGTPAFTVMHDWWLYLLASSFGDVVFDPVPHMYYRQHTDNTVGVQKNRCQEFLARVKRFRGNRYNIHNQAAALQAFCERENLVMQEDNQELLQQLLLAHERVSVRWKLVRNPRLHRQRRGDSFLFSLILLTGTM